MATGIRIHGVDSNQAIQIGTGYQNLQLLKSGTISSTTFVAEGGPLFSYFLPPSGPLPVPSDPNALFVIRYLTTNSTFGYCTLKRRLAVSGAITTSIFVADNAPLKNIEYYIFGQGDAPVSGDVALRIKTEDGVVSYDSRRKQLRVLQSIPLPDVAGGLTLLGQFFPGKKIGLALSNPRFLYRAPTQERCFVNTDQLSMDSSNNVWISNRQVLERVEAGAFPLGTVTAANAAASVLIIDLDEIPIPFN